MNKIDSAWDALKALSPREQEIAADAILDFAALANGPELSDQQGLEIERRLQDAGEQVVTPAELRSRIEN